MKTQELELNFQLESLRVAEIVADKDDWTGDGIEQIPNDDLQEMVKGDEKPFFVEFVALYEGVSGNNREYTREAVETCVQAMPGVNMYKGHEEPGTTDWKYREPVGKIVAARVAEIQVDGRRVLAAKGKAYISEADAKLRSDISKKMAGPLSILGNARAVRELGSSKRTITRIHNPLKSIDFCNPGTNGMPLAGVTAVVREMSGTDPNTDPEEQPNGASMGKLNKQELLAEYGSVITELVGEQLEDRVKEMAAEKREIADLRQSIEDAKKEQDTKIAEMQTQIDDLTKERDEANKALGERDAAVLKANLQAFATEHVAEMKDSEDHDTKIVEMAAKDLTPDVVDNDLEKSKTAFKDKLAKAIGKIEELAEMVGGKHSDDDEKPTRRHQKNPPKGKKGPELNRFLSPELQKAGAGKE